MVSFAIYTGRWDIQGLFASSGVMFSSALYADCLFITVSGSVAMCLAAEALYRGFAGFEFFPVYLYVFYKSDMIYLCHNNSGGEGDSIYWISCQCGDFRADYRVYSLVFNAIAYPGFGKFDESF